MMGSTPNQIGPYEITREIGRGGMGVVYLARDTKLDRDVAIKCLPDDFADDHERLSRFQREAKALASLNHTNIASIYGLEEVDSKQYLILEYVPGETLSQVLDHGPMPVSEALPIAKQIAEAIEAAHTNGIIHRDLKPANIKFASGDQIKILDFGLAKAFEEHPSSASEIAASPTYIPSNTPTMPGVVLGTAGYLSPEQARGRTVDKRTDIFSFGCVLYEMLVGKTVFPGETVTDSLGATLHKEPNWDDLPEDTPPTIMLLLRKCLAKDRKRRLQDIGDARIEIEQAIDDPSSTSLGLAAFALGSTKSPRLTASHIAIAAVLIVISAITAWIFKPAPHVEPKQVVRLSIDLDDSTRRTNLSISPDGTKLVYSARVAVPDPDGGENQTQLWLRRLDTFKATPIPNTENGETPSFSPDGTRILFRVDKQLGGSNREADLKIIELDGRAPRTVTSEAFNRIRPLWISDDELAYFDNKDGIRLMRISARGGEPRLIADLETLGTGTIFTASTLPGGEWIAISFVEIVDALSFGVKLVELATGEIHPFLENAIGAKFIPNGPVIFYRSGTVVAGDVDMTSHPPKVSIDLTTVLDGLSSTLEGFDFDVSNSGHLVVVEGRDDSETTLALVDSTGKIEDYPAEARRYAAAQSFSADGKRLAYTAASEESIPEIWVMELDTGSVRKLSNEDEVAILARWLPDGRLVYGRFISPEEGELLAVEIHRSAKPQPLFAEDSSQQHSTEMLNFDITHDGSVIVYSRKAKGRDDMDIWMRAVDGSDEPRPLLESTSNEDLARFSPDGKWLTFQSDESGRLEVYAKPFAMDENQSEQVIPISKAGGVAGVWSGDMTKIFYLDQKRTNLFVVEIEIAEGQLSASEPKLVSDMKSLGASGWSFPFLPIPDSDKLLYVKKSEAAQRNNRIDIVLNWIEEYKANKARSN